MTFMNQRQFDKMCILADSYGKGPSSMIESLKGSKRNITLFEEKVLRACHHEFDCLTQTEASVKLGVSSATISRTLRELEERAKTCKPIRIMFPILTSQQFEIYKCLVNCGMSAAEVSAELDITESAVNKAATIMRAKGANIPKRCDLPKTKSYVPSMDKTVTHKF
jgi:DNA-binding MarR family transcriptional regulator